VVEGQDGVKRALRARQFDASDQRERA